MNALNAVLHIARSIKMTTQAYTIALGFDKRHLVHCLEAYADNLDNTSTESTNVED